MALIVASGETGLNGTRASWARVPIILLNYTCWWSVPRWTKKKGYSSSPSSSTPKSGRCLFITQTVSLGQIFQNLMLMGHFGRMIGVQTALHSSTGCTVLNCVAQPTVTTDKITRFLTIFFFVVWTWFDYIYFK